MHLLKAGIVGFAGTGHTIQILGMIPTFVLGAFSQLIAIVLLIPIRVPDREELPMKKGM